jgi:hypothetical protein
MAGWWLLLTPLKNDGVRKNGKDDNHPIEMMETCYPNVPNHQPVK